jgi:RNA polymerase sigma factor (sigma-70 family)
MATSQMSEVIQHVLGAVLRRDGAGLTDGQLLEDYVSRRNEAALAALAGRHGPMVWGVCRRVLRNYHDAEDAFQATFLVLIRRAASIASRASVGNWLYGVAHQTALKARATTAKRGTRERQVTAMPEPAVVEQDLWPELEPLLDEELSRLPDKYRAVIVLCDLEGKTRRGAAEQLGCPEGTVAGRLARARTMLAKRLTQRGVTLSCGALAAVLTQNVASAGVPALVVSNTIMAGSLSAAGQAAATGGIPVKAAALAEGVMKAMLFTRLRAAVALVLMLGFVATGATILTCRTAAGQDDEKPAAEKPVEPAAKQEEEKEAEDFTAWGKEVGGVQAGLSYLPGKRRAYYHSQTVKLVVRVRNVGKESVQLQYVKTFFVEEPPIVTDAGGKPLSLDSYPIPKEKRDLVKLDLAPGKEVEIDTMQLQLRPEGFVDQFSPIALDPTIRGTGKFRVRYGRLAPADIDNIGAKLSTGELKLEIKADPPPAVGKQSQLRQKPDEAFTAWGKEIAGLQASLGYKPGQKRAYSHGETVSLVVRVRNVGKEDVKFQYARQFFIEKPPSVTDGEGKLVPPLARVVPFGDYGIHNPVEVNLAPGKGIELYELKLELRSGNSVTLDSVSLDRLWASGKVRIQYERLASPDIDEILGKLTTGKLELEIKSDPPAATEKK